MTDAYTPMYLRAVPYEQVLSTDANAFGLDPEWDYRINRIDSYLVKDLKIAAKTLDKFLELDPEHTPVKEIFGNKWINLPGLLYLLENEGNRTKYTDKIYSHLEKMSKKRPWPLVTSTMQLRAEIETLSPDNLLDWSECKDMIMLSVPDIAYELEVDRFGLYKKVHKNNMWHLPENSLIPKKKFVMLSSLASYCKIARRGLIFEPFEDFMTESFGPKETRRILKRPGPISDETVYDPSFRGERIPDIDRGTLDLCEIFNFAKKGIFYED